MFSYLLNTVLALVSICCYQSVALPLSMQKVKIVLLMTVQFMFPVTRLACVSATLRTPQMHKIGLFVCHLVYSISFKPLSGYLSARGVCSKTAEVIYICANIGFHQPLQGLNNKNGALYIYTYANHMLELKLMRIVRRPSVFRLMFRFDVLATVNVFPGAICCT